MEVELIHSKDFTFKSWSESQQEITLGASKELGGEGKDYRPMQLMLLALASCSSFDIVAIFKKKKLAFSDFKITAKGKRREEIPNIFTEIKLHYSVKVNLNGETFAKYIDLALNKYCSVRAMLQENIAVSFTHRITPLS